VPLHLSPLLSVMLLPQLLSVLLSLLSVPSLLSLVPWLSRHALLYLVQLLG